MLHVESFVTFNEYISHHEAVEPSSSEYIISEHVAQFALSNFQNGSWESFQFVSGNSYHQEQSGHLCSVLSQAVSAGSSEFLL